MIQHTRSTLRSIFVPAALALAILACQAASNLPNPFATATPTSTLTPTSTPTSTPTLTPTPAPAGIHTEDLPGGDVLVKDYDNKYELTVSSEWKLIPLTKEELEKMSEPGAQQDPELSRIVKSFKTLDTDIFRVVGIASNPKYTDSDYPTFFVITAFSDPIASSMPMDFVTAMIEDNIIPDATDKASSAKTNANGIEVGVTTGLLNLDISSTKRVPAACKLLAFQSNNKLIVINFIAARRLKDTALPLADKFIDTIKLLNPDGTEKGGA